MIECINILTFVIYQEKTLNKYYILKEKQKILVHWQMI